jgi:hypothetical protein
MATKLIISSVFVCPARLIGRLNNYNGQYTQLSYYMIAEDKCCYITFSFANQRRRITHTHTRESQFQRKNTRGPTQYIILPTCKKQPAPCSQRAVLLHVCARAVAKSIHFCLVSVIIVLNAQSKQRHRLSLLRLIFEQRCFLALTSRNTHV